MSPSYSCLHCVLSCAAVGLGWPLAGLAAVLRLLATHVAKSGESGTVALGAAAAFALACPAWEIAAICIQWSNVAFLIDWSPTLTTALPGTSLPHAPSARAGTTKKAPSARERYLRSMREKTLGRLNSPA